MVYKKYKMKADGECNFFVTESGLEDIE